MIVDSLSLTMPFEHAHAKPLYVSKNHPEQSQDIWETLDRLRQNHQQQLKIQEIRLKMQEHSRREAKAYLDYYRYLTKTSLQKELWQMQRLYNDKTVDMFRINLYITQGQEKLQWTEHPIRASILKLSLSFADFHKYFVQLALDLYQHKMDHTNKRLASL